jgi:hypothetical protein
MTKEQAMERLQKLWIKASSSCGGATPQLVAEIREVEKVLKELEQSFPSVEDTGPRNGP